ncbi:hypothetical protein CXB51_025591 [Gossypium anomalum]|uniref:DUF7745 domain-containing protein n=1 Tax=Gossypium anomalum TaxID=47600 RepID=A0A8J6CUY0_9ROSI|nr:hypothetical protein CXB51_025591 [Gossypium anomalum]
MPWFETGESLKIQREKGDSLVEGCCQFAEHTTVNVRQNNLEDLVRVWNQWDSDTRGISPRDEQLIQAMVRFWDPAYQCFTFNQKDMTPTIEEYAALLRIDNAKTRSQPCPDYLSRDIQVLKYLSKGRKGTIYRVCTAAQCLDFESFLESRAHSIPHVFKNIRPARSLPQERMAERILLYKCRSQDWVPLLGLWGGVGYAPLLVQRQFSSRQFIPGTGGLVQSEFAFTGEGYMKKVRDTAKSWNKIHFIELALYADTLTQDYDLWRKQRNPFLEEMPSELEIARQEFEREKAKMSKDLNTLQEENYQLRLKLRLKDPELKKYKGRPRSQQLSGKKKKLATSKEEWSFGREKQRKKRKRPRALQ